MSRFGLVIQGPLLSVGEKTGRTAHIPRGKHSGMISYDCRDNIRALVKDFGHLFDLVVISTWENEVRPGDSWPGAFLLASDDGQLPKKERNNYRGQKVPDNRFRQMFSMLVGTEYLQANSNVDIVVKVRTDQYLNLAELLNSIERFQNFPAYTKEVIFVPNLMTAFVPVTTVEARWAIGDFYFAGNTETMRAFAKSFFTYGGFEFDPSDHREPWLKYAYVAHRDSLEVPEFAYFPTSHQNAYCPDTLYICKFMMRRVFWPLSFATFRSVVWRGEPLSKEALEHAQRNSVFEENYFERVAGLFSIHCPRFLGIHWWRYADFRCTVLKQPFSFKEQIFLFINMTAQFVVRFLKRAGHYGRYPADIPALMKRKLRWL